MEYNRTCHLMLCELHYPIIHGKTDDSDKNIETHYLVYEIYDPTNGMSLGYFDDSESNSESVSESDSESDSDSDSMNTSEMDETIEFLQTFYSSNEMQLNANIHHPTIRNYHNIVSRPNYIRPEIGLYIILPTQEAIAILKTYWIRIIQRKWKKVFQERQKIIQQRCNIIRLSSRRIYGRWPTNYNILPGLKGMLNELT